MAANLLLRTFKRVCHVLKLISRFRRDEYGVTMVEYVLLVGCIAMACFAAIQLLGSQINAFFMFLTAALIAVI
jgi:Flp pilus assembly pilin Flp